MNHAIGDGSHAATSRRHPLERLLSPVPSVSISETESATTPQSHNGTEGSIVCSRGTGAPEWIERGKWRLLVRATSGPTAALDEVARFQLDDDRVARVSRDPETRTVFVPFSLAEAYENYVSEAWKEQTAARRLSSRQLAAYYLVKRFIPRSLQLFARRQLAPWQSSVDFPAWPYDDSISMLVRFYGLCLLQALDAPEIEFRWFWPHTHRAALILTHDVETAEGLRLATDIADLEESRGFRSSFNIVADWYPVDRGILRELAGRGFELGVHGVHHDRSLFSSRRSFERQLPLISAWADEIGAVGFRSPATHRVFPWLGDLPVKYDATMPHSDPYEPVPGGACSVWPFFIRDVVELPYTLPQDHTLFTVLRERGPDIWLRQADVVTDAFGLIQCVTHPDPGYLGDRLKREHYITLLDNLADRPELWRALPREVAQWWRDRDSGTVTPAASRGTIRVADGIVEIVPPHGQC